MRVGREYAYQRSRTHYGRASRVKLLETKLHREIAYLHTSRKADGVRVAFLKDDDGVLREQVVPSSKIVSTWKDEQERVKARDKAQEEQQAVQQKLTDRVTAAREALGLEDNYRGSTLSVDQLEHFGALLSAARKAVNAPLQQAKELDDLREAIWTFDFR